MDLDITSMEDMCVRYLYGSVLCLSETPQWAEKVDVGALKKLLLCFAELLLSFSTLE